MKTFNQYLIKNLKFSLTRVFYYIIALIFVLFSVAGFFFGNEFFSENGNTNLIPFFTIIPFICIIIIPCLCFKHSDSIYDDFIPLRNIQKLVVKFISLLIQYLILLILVVPVPVFVSFFGNIDAGAIFTSFLCLILFGACEISLCLLLNEVCENSITSLIVSVIILGISNVSHLFSIYVPVNVFFTNIFKLLSFSWHFDAAGKGIFDTRDVIWFIFLSILFLYFASFIKEKKLGLILSKKNKVTHYFIISLFFLVILNGQRWFTRIDFSKNKTYSVSSYTKNLLKQSEHNIKITYYRSGNLSKYYPQIRDIGDFLQSYCSAGKNITFTIKDPDDDTESLNLLGYYGITSQQMRAVKNTNSVEYVNVYSAIVIEYLGNVEIIPYILSAQTLEYDLDGRIKHLITGKTRLVNIIIGNDLSIDDSNGYNMIIPWLNSQGFLCNPISIESPTFITELDQTSGPLLVIGDSKILIDQAVAIENYIFSNKGNVLFNISPYSVDFSSWSVNENRNTNLIEVLENWGITFTNRIAADNSCASITLESQSDEAADSYLQNNVYREEVAYPLFISLLPQKNSNLGFTEYWATPIEINDDKVKPYLFSTNSSWYYEVDRNKSENLIETNPFNLLNEEITSKKKGTQILGVQINGPLDGLYNAYSCDNSNIIVIPDQYMCHTLLNFAYLNNDYRNFDFLTNCLLKLNNEYELAELQSKTTFDTSFYKITSQNQFIKYRNIIYIFYFVIIPVVLFLVLFISYLIHKRKILNETK